MNRLLTTVSTPWLQALSQDPSFWVVFWSMMFHHPDSPMTFNGLQSGRPFGNDWVPTILDTQGVNEFLPSPETKPACEWFVSIRFDRFPLRQKAYFQWFSLFVSGSVSIVGG